MIDLRQILPIDVARPGGHIERVERAGAPFTIFCTGRCSLILHLELLPRWTYRKGELVRDLHDFDPLRVFDAIPRLT